MVHERPITRSATIAVATFVVSAAIIIAMWVAADIRWSFIIIRMLGPVAVCWYAYVLGRRANSRSQRATSSQVKVVVTPVSQSRRSIAYATEATGAPPLTGQPSR